VLREAQAGERGGRMSGADTPARGRRSYGSGSLTAKRLGGGQEVWVGLWYDAAGKRVKRHVGPKRTPGERTGLTKSQAERELAALHDGRAAVRLDDEDIAAIAASVVDLMTRPGPAGRDTGRLATASDVARALGVSRSWVYANKVRLGAIRLGSGPRARLRFDLAQAQAAFAADPRHQTDAEPPRPPRRRARRKRALPDGVPLIRGRSER